MPATSTGQNILMDGGQYPGTYYAARHDLPSLASRSRWSERAGRSRLRKLKASGHRKGRGGGRRPGAWPSRPRGRSSGPSGTRRTASVPVGYFSRRAARASACRCRPARRPAGRCRRCGRSAGPSRRSSVIAPAGAPAGRPRRRGRGPVLQRDRRRRDAQAA